MADINLRQILVLYTTAVCNLNCSYCYIDKNPALKHIDDILDDSFKDENYYFDFAKEIFPNPQQLKEIQYWGGEPTLRFDRAYNITEKLIEYYPNLKSFLFSTNFIGNHWFEQVTNFLNILAKFPDREFILSIQLSIDGPENINDYGRGKGTTKAFLKNFQIFIQKIKDQNWIPKNVKVKSFFKPTLSLETLKFLQTKEDVKKYYDFFDLLTASISYYIYPNFNFDCSLPTMAEPMQATKEDGLRFKQFCKLCSELEEENKTEHFYQIYNSLIPANHIKTRENDQYNLKFFTFDHGCNTCGAGVIILGLLPNKKISLCHNGFVDLLQEYKEFCKQNVQNNTLKEKQIDDNFFNRDKLIRGTNCDVDNLKQWTDVVDCFRDKNATFQKVNFISQIRELAKLKLIDEKYNDFEKAKRAASFLDGDQPFCLRNNLATNGTMILHPLGTLKLFLNGALDYIIGEEI